jgi:hypothetical protein
MTDETAKTPPPASFRSRALGGLRSASNLTPEQRSERARKAALAGVEKRNAERAALGLPPTKKPLAEPSANDLEPWLDEVDRLYPDREWPNREARRRQAIMLARTAAAEAASDALKRRANP